jgi:hypothetical protein
MNYANEMGSGVTIYMPSLIKIGSGVQKLTGGIQIHTHTHTHTEEGGIIDYFYFPENKENMLKRFNTMFEEIATRYYLEPVNSDLNPRTLPHFFVPILIFPRCYRLIDLYAYSSTH